MWKTKKVKNNNLLQEKLKYLAKQETLLDSIINNIKILLVLAVFIELMKNLTSLSGRKIVGEVVDGVRELNPHLI